MSHWAEGFGGVRRDYCSDSERRDGGREERLEKAGEKKCSNGSKLSLRFEVCFLEIKWSFDVQLIYCICTDSTIIL